MIRLNHVGIKARDMEKSIKFYTEALELLKLVGHDYVFVGNEQTRIEIERAGENDSPQDVKCTAG